MAAAGTEFEAAGDHDTSSVRRTSDVVPVTVTDKEMLAELLAVPLLVPVLLGVCNDER